MKKVHWSILIGFLFIILIKQPWYHFSSIQKQHRILDLFYSDTRPGPTSIWRSNKIFLLKFAIPLVLLFMSGFYMFRFALPKIKTKLLKHLLIVSFLILTFFVLFGNWIYKKIYELTAFSFIEWPMEVLLMSFIQYLLIFYAIKVFHTNEISFKKYSSSSLSENDKLNHIEQLKLIMEQQKLYLNSKITLSKVAEMLNVNTAYLSQAINSQLDTRFSDFINSYRIEEAKKLLKNPEYNKYTIEAIAKKAGFQSESAFYKAFRKFTGLSPNKYKKTSDL